MNRRGFLRTGMLAAGCVAGVRTASAQIKNINSAINKAGRQRMLSQRMAKAYLQVGQQIDLNRSRRILNDSVSLFDTQLGELAAFAPTAETKGTYQELRRAWLSYREALTAHQPDQENARRIMVLNEEVLALAHAGTVQLEKISGTQFGRYVNISGRQRMLSQRMAKFFQAMQWQVGATDTQDKLMQARREFIAGLRQLSEAPENTPELKRTLLLAQTQWLFFDNAITASSTQSTIQRQLATNVATTSERILEVMEEATGMYERLS